MADQRASYVHAIRGVLRDVREKAALFGRRPVLPSAPEGVDPDLIRIIGEQAVFNNRRNAARAFKAPLSAKTRWRDHFRFDDLDDVETLMAAEEAANRQFSDEEWAGAHTLGDLSRLYTERRDDPTGIPAYYAGKQPTPPKAKHAADCFSPVPRTLTLMNASRFTRVDTPIGHYWTSPLSRDQLAKRAADSAGAGGDGSFEQAFSSLAYTYLKDKSPKLLEHLIGFQLVDRNEDNTKALGVFGIKLGDQFLYAPAFFLNGELKGHELLFLAKQSVFVPNKESWVNFLLSRRPHILGEASSRSAFELGGLSPDLSRLSRLPFMGKTGCDAWARPFVALYAAAALGRGERLMAKHAADGPAFDLKARAAADPDLARALFKVASTRPGFMAGLRRFYGRDFFGDVAACLGQKRAALELRLLPAAPVDVPAPPRRPAGGLLPPSAAEKAAAEAVEGAKKLKVYDDVAFTRNLPELDDAERARLMRDLVLLKDDRDSQSVSTIYDIQVRQDLINPSRTGIYRVLERPGAFARMLVAYAPHSSRGREGFATLVRLDGDGGKEWGNFDRQDLWVRQGDSDKDDDDYSGWFDGLGDARPEVDSSYVAVGPDGDATAPFTVRGNLGDGCYKVDFEVGCGPPLRSPSSSPRSSGWDDYRSPYGATLRLNSRKGSRPRALRDDFHLPESWKFVKVRDWRDRGELIQPGDLQDLQVRFSEKTAALAVYNDGPDYTIVSPLGRERAGFRDALVSLARCHGLREKAARDLLSVAGRDRKAECRIKYAAPYPMWGGGGGSIAPPFPPELRGVESNGPNAVSAIYPQEERLPVPALDSGLTDPSVYDPWRNFSYDQGGARAAESAGSRGDRELFDTTALSTLTKALGSDVKGEGDLPVYMKSLDKLGRRLFLLYWHGEDYEERYGKHDMPELEDSLRNAFLVLGDVVLFLKQKSVSPIFENLGNPDIDDAAGN